MPKPATIATREAIRLGTLALTEAAKAPGNGLASNRIIKPLHRILFGLIQASGTIAPVPTAENWTPVEKAIDPFSSATIDLIEETMRRAAQASLLDGKHPSEAVREVERNLKAVIKFCADRHAGGQR